MVETFLERVFVKLEPMLAVDPRGRERERLPSQSMPPLARGVDKRFGPTQHRPCHCPKTFVEAHIDTVEQCADVRDGPSIVWLRLPQPVYTCPSDARDKTLCNALLHRTSSMYTHSAGATEHRLSTEFMF
eukprot:m.603941 g.603941  ORF g.603941 m.603941 type:complete len:130 (+) comp22456_c0_seq23:1006-1395(+)